MVFSDVLRPSESAKYVMKHGNLVKINRNGVENVAKQILRAVKDGSIEQVAFAAHKLHPKTADKTAIQWVFLIDTVNFSFWPDEGEHYDVSYNSEKYTGYYAGCAALNRALDSGINVLDAKWMAEVGLEEIDRVFKSDSGHSIPLLEERVKAINNSGQILLQKFDGYFYNAILAAQKSAQNLLEIIVENFESFQSSNSGGRLLWCIGGKG
ncbi:unnamed protein product [Caenorhabditis angaria]|uniref:Queuosine 5'-phosphate N-glycosylase/hydrolase n=1 Tax=Caenorhabditis angaria TaxID=860376 RepID=A0A9P1IKX4_9PELO|nr:unnamed protein product [Caenorhabditis angaria]